MTDRLTGLLGLLLALAYGIVGGGYKSNFISDPLGPSVFPVLLAVALGAFSVLLALRPRGGAEWPAGAAWARNLAAVGAMVVYGLVVETIGFVVASFLLVAVLVRLMSGSVPYALATGLAASLLLYGTFDWLLGLPLPTGSVFAALSGS